MKKIFAILTSAIVLMGAWSCNKTNGSKSQEEPGPDYAVLITLTDVTFYTGVFEIKLTSKNPIVKCGLIFEKGEVTPRLDDEVYQTIVHEFEEKTYSFQDGDWVVDTLLSDYTYSVCGWMEVDMGDGNIQTFYGNTVTFKTLPSEY